MPFELLTTSVLETYVNAMNLISSMRTKIPNNPATASLYYRHITEIQSALSGLTDMLHGAFTDLKRSPVGGKMWELAKGLMDEVVDMLEDLDRAIDVVVEAEKEVKRQVDEVTGIVEVEAPVGVADVEREC
ncbi:unnamed protein product [Tuber aestivum]|uniref:Uncharacterized protein n=1 Tax=Tuber aestivum TaxID=59557 RepID=A0A292Q1D7_9PEZI|nr:unnamed protein product [Tuber aestivum]